MDADGRVKVHGPTRSDPSVNPGRTGPFWDSVDGRAPIPPAAATLGLEIMEIDGERGTAVLAFTGTEAFTNPMGEVLGAFLAAMLYDTVGPTLLATLGPEEFQSTLSLDVTFVKAARPGRFTGTGRVVRRQGDTALLEGSLADSAGDVVATATATAAVIAR